MSLNKKESCRMMNDRIKNLISEPRERECRRQLLFCQVSAVNWSHVISQSAERQDGGSQQLISVNLVLLKRERNMAPTWQHGHLDFSLVLFYCALQRMKTLAFVFGFIVHYCFGTELCRFWIELKFRCLISDQMKCQLVN